MNRNFHMIQVILRIHKSRIGRQSFLLLVLHIFQHIIIIIEKKCGYPLVYQIPVREIFYDVDALLFRHPFPVRAILGYGDEYIRHHHYSGAGVNFSGITMKRIARTIQFFMMVSGPFGNLFKSFEFKVVYKVVKSWCGEAFHLDNRRTPCSRQTESPPNNVPYVLGKTR